MQLPFGRLLSRSPFPGIQAHMGAARTCSEMLSNLFNALASGDEHRLRDVVKEISRSEGEADALKNELRDHLPRRLFLSVDRRDLLQLIGEVDRIADSAEDVAVLLSLRTYKFPSSLRDAVLQLVEQVLDTVEKAEATLAHLELLSASGFSRRVTRDALASIARVAQAEHEADKLQDQAAKLIFGLES